MNEWMSPVVYVSDAPLLQTNGKLPLWFRKLVSSTINLCCASPINYNIDHFTDNQWSSDFVSVFSRVGVRPPLPSNQRRVLVRCGVGGRSSWTHWPSAPTSPRVPLRVRRKRRRRSRNSTLRAWRVCSERGRRRRMSRRRRRARLARRENVIGRLYSSQ